MDFGYRLNPDGSESKQCFSEEHYDVAQNLNGNSSGVVERQRSDKRTVHYPVADSVVYAAIKSEPSSSLSPPFEPKFNCGMIFLFFNQIFSISTLIQYTRDFVRIQRNTKQSINSLHFFSYL